MNSIVCTIQKVASKEMCSVGTRLRQMLEKDENVTAESLLAIAVSFDGTVSFEAIHLFCREVVIISVDSGEALDFHVLSKFCKSCSIWEHKKSNEPAKYEKWKANHESVCTANFEGSSQAPYKPKQRRLWQFMKRSTPSLYSQLPPPK